MPDKPSVAYQILGPIADANIDVDMIIQNVSQEGLADFSFTVNRSDYAKARAILEQSAAKLGARGVTGEIGRAHV